MNGIIIVNKPKGITSRDVVNVISKKLNTKKVGHCGTLDPLACGVLIICVGKYTKLNNLLTSKEKEYIAEVVLGVETDTLDITGNIIQKNNDTISKEEIQNIFDEFPKKYMQEVPKYSAVKINGKKLYEYARENIDVELPKKEVNIYSLKLLEYNSNKFKFKTEVSKGTYIRSLIKDILLKANKIGTMNNLTRTKQGKFDIKDSYTLSDIEKDNYKMLKIRDIFDYKVIKVSGDLKNKIINGTKVKYNYDKVLFVDENDNELAIYKKEKDYMKVEIML